MVLQVVDVYFPKHPVTNQRQAFCFVTFSTRKVIKNIKRTPLDMRSSKVFCFCCCSGLPDC